MKSLALLLILLTSSLSAMAAKPLCYQQEIHPHTGKVFQSQQEYEGFLADWSRQEPPPANPFFLMKAYGIYNREKAVSLSLGNDKTAHCYLGCRISMDVNLKTAIYVGWLKEQRDITDCNRSSSFETADYDATVHGAEMGTSLRSAEECQRACKQTY